MPAAPLLRSRRPRISYPPLSRSPSHGLGNAIPCFCIPHSPLSHSPTLAFAFVIRRFRVHPLPPLHSSVKGFTSTNPWFRVGYPLVSRWLSLGFALARHCPCVRKPMDSDN